MARKPVIFIPGFVGSELHNRTTGEVLFPPPLIKLLDPAKKAALLAQLRAVPGNVEAGLPIASLLGGIVQEAQSIYNILRDQFGYDVTFTSPDFIPVGWDWRQGVGATPTIDSITDALDELSPQKNGNVVGIIHSAGGLVLRAFLERKPAYAACFEQLLTFGAPWAGTLEALHAVTQGVSIKFLFIKLLTNAEGQGLMGRAVSAYDLFPTDPSLGLFFDAAGAPTTPLTDQSWITQQFMRDAAAQAHAPFPQQFGALPVTNVCGWGAPTLKKASINAATGKVAFEAKDKEIGDGTVPFASAAWLRGANVRSMFLPIGAYATGFLPKVHGQLWDSPPVLQLFDEVLGTSAKAPFLCAAADSDDYIDFSRPFRLRVSAMAGDGSPLPNLRINADINGNRIPIPLLADNKRGMRPISRSGIRHNIGSDLFRFMVEFSWTGGSDKRAVLIRST